MRKLNNPIHLFRRDGLAVECPLFTGKFFQRGEQLSRALNFGVAARHLVLNHRISQVPAECFKIYRNAFFKQNWLDFRVEDPLLQGSRLSVITERSKLHTVIKAKIKRRVEYHALEIVEQYATGDLDLLIIANERVFYASDECLRNYIAIVLEKAGTLARVPKWYTHPPPYSGAKDSTQAELLLETYKRDPASLQANIEKLSQELSKPSLLSVIPTKHYCKAPTKKSIAAVKSRTRALRSYSRSLRIFSFLYRFLSNSYSAILSLTHKLDSLPAIVLHIQTKLN